jgi:hypothetical protein
MQYSHYQAKSNNIMSNEYMKFLFALCEEMKHQEGKRWIAIKEKFLLFANTHSQLFSMGNVAQQFLDKIKQNDPNQIKEALFAIKTIMVENDIPKIAELVSAKKAKGKPLADSIAKEIEALKRMQLQDTFTMLKTIVDDSKESPLRDYMVVYSNEIILNNKPSIGYFTRDNYLNVLDEKDNVLLTCNLLKVGI